MTDVHAVSYRHEERQPDKNRERERDDGDIIALSPNSGFPAA